MRRDASLDLVALLDEASAIVDRAAGKLMEMQQAPLTATRKTLRDIVTEADLASEAIVVPGLRALTPGAGVLAEEGGEERGADDARWIVDPLDGTVNYARGLPWFSVTAAYEQAGEIMVGVLRAPAAGIEARYARGRIAEVDGRPARVSTTTTLADAVVSVILTSHFSRDEVRAAAAVIECLGGIARGVRVVVSGGLEVALVASGRLDAFVSLKADAVSHAGTMEIVRAAGGRVTTLAGVDSRVDDLQKIASNGHLHDELLDRIRETLRG